MNSYCLISDGDSLEKYYWNLFIRDNFSSYETFWVKNIVPLTNRPKDIHTKTDKELALINKSSSDICISQLHYSVLRHMARVYELLQVSPIDLDILTEGMVRICGALDVAFELLERVKNPAKYDPWLEKKKNGKLGSKDARQNWQAANKYPLQHLRDYRNHLIHGRLLPCINNFYFPKIGTEMKYFDWRVLTDSNHHPGLDINDLQPAQSILNNAWLETLKYFEEKWKTELL